MRFRISYLVMIVVLFSCEKGPTEIRVFKNIPLLITKERYSGIIDSIRKSDRSFSYVLHKEMKWVRFIDKTSDNEPYYGFMLPSFDKGLLSGLTLYYLRGESLFIMEENLLSNAHLLDFWMGKDGLPLDLKKHLHAELSIKYGKEYTTRVNQLPKEVIQHIDSWENRGLKIDLIHETNSNYPNSPFNSYKIVYKLTDEFKKENQSELQKLREHESKY